MAHTAAADSSTPLRPGLRRLLTQLATQGLVLLNAIIFVRPQLVTLPGYLLGLAGILLALALLSWGAVRQARSARLLHPDIPVLQRVAMGDASDEAQRRQARDLTLDRSWLFGRVWWTGFLVAHLAIMLWPARWGLAWLTPDFRVASLTALHIAAGVYVFHLWLKARSRQATL